MLQSHRSNGFAQSLFAVKSAAGFSGVLWMALLVVSVFMVGCNGPSIDRHEITYYQPHEATGMKITSSAGPDNEALFELKDPDIRVMVIAQPSYEPARIWMSIHLPEGLSMKIVGDHFTLTALDDSPTRTAKINRIRGTFMINGEGIYRDFQVGEELQGASAAGFTHFWGKRTTTARHFEINAPLGDTKTNKLPQSFELLMPEILIGGKPLVLPPLYFSRKIGKFFIKNRINNQPW